MSSILAIILGIYHNQFKCIYFKNRKRFVDIVLLFQNLRKILNILKKNLEFHSLSISEFIHSENLECIAGPVSEHPSAGNVLTAPKLCRSLRRSTFILLFHHSDIDRASERPT